MTPKRPKTPSPPKSLGPAGRRFWRETLENYVLEDSHHFRLLESAAAALDRIDAAREQITRDGVTIKNRFGEVVAHPACNVERQSANIFRANVRELGFDVELPEVRGPRRPGTRS